MPKVSKHEEKMVNLQVQLRQNQSELQDYLADLGSWETDIKKKEEQLKAGKLEKQADTLPPVRNTIHKKKLKKKKKEKVVDPSKPKKISGYDFRAWDQFDVDAACDEIDKEEDKQETSSSEYETDEEWEMERKKHLAGQEKEKGNGFLKNGDLDQAVEAYSKGIEYDPTNAILPANRAMALLKQQKFGAAELDCTTSISLDPLYVKAYLRRAAARSGMNKLQEAVADFNRVLDLEPSNKQAKTEIERLQKELQRDKEAPVATTLTEDEKGRVKPIYKPPEERSKKPLTRIQIEEIGLEATMRPAPSLEQSELAKQIVDKEKKEFDKLFSDSSRKNTQNGPSTGEESKTPMLKVDGLDSKPASDSVRKPKIVETSVSTAASTPPANQKVNAKKTKNLPNGDSQHAEFKSPDISSKSQENNSNDNLDSIPKQHVPQTSFQFQSDFKTLKNKPEAFFSYIQAVPPTMYSKLFGQSFDAEILVTILKVLESFSDKANLYDILNGLTLVKRFSMTAMFLSKKDKSVAQHLMEIIQGRGKCSEQDLAALKQKYDL